MNKALLVGNLTRDPEGGYTAGNVPYCRFTVAINRRHTDQNGQRQADFITVVAWRATAENCVKYLAKGRKVAVVGEIRTRTYDDPDGNRRYVTEVEAETVEFLSPRGDTAPDDDTDQ